MLEVQKLFKSYVNTMSTNGMEQFKSALSEIGVDVRDYPEYGFMHLDYNMIECIKTHPIVIECRGLIMDYDGNILCKSFDRFFNLGENGVDTFDFANSVAFEKADGSLVRVYFNNKTNKWEIATRGTAFAEGNFEGFGMKHTFRDYILHCMNQTEIQFQDACNKHLDKKLTYCMEAIGQSNRIVTKYTKDELVLLSAINKETNEEYIPTPDVVEWFRNTVGWNVRAIKQYSFATQADCLATLGDLPDLGEGYVVFNKLTGGRVKIKSPAYVAAHRLRGNGLNVNSICELVAMNEVDEYLAVFESDKDKFEPAQKILAEMREELERNYSCATIYMELFEGRPTAQKEFALYVKDLPLSSVMFKARKDKVDILHAFDSVDVNKRADWIKERLITTRVNVI